MGFGKFFKALIGGLAISFIDKAESGTELSMEALLYHKLRKQTKRVRWLRIVWFFWLTFSIYLCLVPFTAEMGTLPMIGGLLIKLESQTAVMTIFSTCLSLCVYLLYCSFLWLSFKRHWPFISLTLASFFITILVVFFKTGQPLSVEEAKKHLGYFWERFTEYWLKLRT